MSTPFASRLRQLRLAARLSQEALAILAGVRRGSVARWEAGVREPLWRHALALAAALGIDANTLAAPVLPATASPSALSSPGA